MCHIGHRKDALLKKGKSESKRDCRRENRTKVLQSMMKEAYKDELDQLIRKVPSLTEADDKTAEKEVESSPKKWSMERHSSPKPGL